MPLDMHTVESPDGCTPAYEDRTIIGILNNYAVPKSPADISSVTVTNAGTLYTALPTLSVTGNGTGAVLVPKMKVLAAAIASIGTGYVQGDTITLTGGTFTSAAIMTLSTTQLASLAVNAAGTGYAATDTITLAGGTPTTKGVATIATTKLISGTINAPGSGYEINDTITLAGGTAGTKAILTVTHGQLVSAAKNAAGSGYAPGDTITLSGGTAGTPAVITVDTVSAGAIATFHISTAGDYTVLATSFTQASTSGIGTGATFDTGLFGVKTVTVSTAGSYTVNATSFTQDSTSGSGTGFTMSAPVFGVNTITISNRGEYQTNAASFTQDSTSGTGTGATFNTAAYGVKAFTISTAGSYSVLATNPVAQGSTSGSGSGATFTLSSWGLASVTVSAGGSGYDNTSALVVTNGTGDTTGSGAAGTLVLGTNTDNVVTVTVELPESANLPMIDDNTPNYGVFINPGQKCDWYVDQSSKTSNSFDVVLTPLSGTAITAGTMDIMISG